MLSYFHGKITSIFRDFIVLEWNGIGYEIFTPRPKEFLVGEERIIYVKDVYREDDRMLVGFSSIDERDLYLALNCVNGIGPKTAVRILGDCKPDELKKAIEANNILYLKNIKGVGDKSAAQILLDLRGFFDLSKDVNINQYDQVAAALLRLHFKKQQVFNVLASISIPDATNQEILTEALRRLNSNGKVINY